MTWHVFEYDQSKTIAASPELSGYGSGACLAIAMKYCVLKKNNTSSLKIENSLIPKQLATWMNDVQDVPLKTLFGDKKFKYYSGGEPITDVSASTKGKINNLQAYSYRLEKMSQWAKASGLQLLDDKVGFPGSTATSNWVRDLLGFAVEGAVAPVFGLISLTGDSDGHAMAYEYRPTPHKVINFFDPNEGEFRSTSISELTAWMTNFFDDSYDDLDQQWWVVKLN